MRLSLLPTLSLAAVSTALRSPGIERSINDNSTVFACNALKLLYESQVFFPGSTNYTAENEHFWTPTDYLAPSCVFTPRAAPDVSTAVLKLAELNASFAVRGGGFMPIPGYANTVGGVLLALTDLSTIELSADKSYVSVGPGRRWEEVYGYLEPYGLVAVGGRVGIVGVPGLLLGGGISFYSNQHGFASDNVISYEVVLANGTIVRATASNYSDLYWALKGGGNSFGIVTRFDLVTYNSPSVCAGINEIPLSEKERFLSAVANFGQYGSADAKAAIFPSVSMFAPENLTVYPVALFYDGTNCAQPALANFTAIPAISNSYGPTTLAAYIEGTNALVADGTRQIFRVSSSLATAEALSIVHDTFVEMVNAQIWEVAGLRASVAFQPVTENLIQQGIDKGDNPQGVDITKAPYFWMVETFSWTDPADDAMINGFAAQVTDAIDAQLQAAGQAAQYLYMNDAGLGQDVFQNYGGNNLAKLQSIRAKYDPGEVYTSLMPGGWKVAGI